MIKKLIFTASLCVFVFGLAHVVRAGTLSCTVTTSCPAGTTIWKMSGTTNAHGEIQSQQNYSQLVCCSGVTNLGTSCSGTFATALKLSGTTNAHGEENSLSNYGTNICISAPAGGSVSVGYQTSDCSGYDTTLASMSGSTNAHLGDASAYSGKICATATGGSQTLSFSISDNSIGFGTLSSGAARYATGDTSGASSDAADAHTISASTNASNGYVMTINGSTLTCAVCGNTTIDSIGGTAAGSSVGSEQFGLRLIVNSGTGAAAAPYNGSNWALDTAAFPDLIATGDGDDVSTEFGVRYLGNISAATESGSYTSTLTYTITASY